MKNPRKYLLSGVIGFSLMASSLGYVYNLDINNEAIKKPAAIMEILPVSVEHLKSDSNIASTIPTGQVNPIGTVNKEADRKSASTSVAVNKQPSTHNTQVATTTTPAAAVPSTVVSQPAPTQSNPVLNTTSTITPASANTTTTKKTSSTRAS